MLTAQCSSSVLGCISPPVGVKVLPTVTNTGPLAGIAVSLGPAILFVNLVFKLIFIAAGIFALFNLIGAGFQFMNAGGDAKNVTAAWDKIMQTFLGIIIMISSFLIAALMGWMIFGDATYFLQPSLLI